MCFIGRIYASRANIVICKLKIYIYFGHRDNICYRGQLVVCKNSNKMVKATKLYTTTEL